MPHNRNREDIFNALYHATKHSLYHYLRRYTQDDHLLKDVMQQCYLRVWEGLDKIDQPEKALPFVRTVAHNLLVDIVRRRMKEDTQWLESIEEEVNALIHQPAESSHLQLQALDIAIDRLPDNCRKVYLLHREHGLSYREIAAQLKVSVSMVEKHMSRAIRLLGKDLLSDYTLVLLLAAAQELIIQR
jgi:RNA polymerase sigma-70 factor (ECF subfamily)